MSTRTENVKRNTLFGLLNKLVLLGFPFVIRIVIIKTIGTDYLGLNSLFTSILSVLSLAELGFGNAIIFCMYKPIAQNDTEEVCALLNYYRNIYKIIGLVILGVGVLIIPFLPKLINGSFPTHISLTALYLMFLVNTSLSYLLFSYYTSLIIACQRNDIINKINMVVSALCYTAQIISLILVKNYYIYVSINILTTIMQNFCVAIVAKKIFPQYKCYGKITDDTKGRIRVRIFGLLIGKMQYVSRNAFDSIFISMFLGLTVTAIYNNYYYIMNAIIGVMQIVITSLTASIGNSVVQETVEKNYRDLMKFNYLYMLLSGWATICLFTLYQPFMTIWMGKDMLFPIEIVLLLCIYFYSLTMGDIRSIYLEVNGLWWENRYKCIFETICNILLNYILGKYFGVYGIITATILTILIINFGYGTRVVYRYYFTQERISKYYLANLKYFIVTSIVLICTYFVASTIYLSSDILNFVLKTLICVLVPPILYIVIYRRSYEYKYSISWLLKVLHLDNTIISKLICG